MSLTSVPDPLLVARAAQQAQILRQHKEHALRLRRRRMHEHRVHVLAATAASVLLAGVLVSGFYLTVIAPPAQTSTTDKSGADSFAATKAGKVWIPVDGGWCKTMNFDNTTGLFSNGQMANCDEVNNTAAIEAQKKRSGDFTSFKNAFHGK
jgi:hypothetical protein